MAEDAVSASAKGATFLILVQIASKALTFTLNQVLLRFLSPVLLGASVQLELYKIGVLYFSRESLRVATERRSAGGVQAAVNISYLALAAGLPIGFALAQWYLYVGHPEVAFFREALRVNELAAAVELISEPAFAAVQQKMLFKIRASAEVPGIMLKTFTIAGLTMLSRHKGIDLGVLPFAIGELVNSTTMTLIYVYQTSRVAQEQKFSLLLQKMKSSLDDQYVLSFFSKPLLWLTASLFFQTGIKWGLTEGDKLLVAAFASLEAQGMYALSANYGGFIARMLFKPIEEICRNLFANLCVTQVSGVVEQEKPSSKASKANSDLLSAATILHDILRAYSIASLLAFAIGPSAAPVLLRFVAGSRWSDSGAGAVLGTYCYYIPFLAINGVSEAFVAATASTSDLQNQSLWMTGFSVVFAGSAYVLLQTLNMGAKGLVYANCINMALRIVFNLRFVRRFFRVHGQDFATASVLPSMYAVAGAIVAHSFLSQSTDVELLRPYGAVGDIARIGFAGAVAASILAFTERQFLRDSLKKLR